MLTRGGGVRNLENLADVIFEGPQMKLVLFLRLILQASFHYRIISILAFKCGLLLLSESVEKHDGSDEKDNAGENGEHARHDEQVSN